MLGCIFAYIPSLENEVGGGGRRTFTGVGDWLNFQCGSTRARGVDDDDGDDNNSKDPALMVEARDYLREKEGI